MGWNQEEARMLGGGRSAGARCSSNNGEKERASVNQHHSVLHGWKGFCLTSICQTKRKLGTRTLPSCLTVVAASLLEGILLVPSTAEVFAAGSGSRGPSEPWRRAVSTGAGGPVKERVLCGEALQLSSPHLLHPDRSMEG